jgi:hypothetical protein
MRLNKENDKKENDDEKRKNRKRELRKRVKPDFGNNSQIRKRIRYD